MHKVLSSGGLNRKILWLHSQTGLNVQHIQKLIAIAVIEKLLPVGTIIKGGNSLSLRFPLQTTRYTQDLDLTFTTSFDVWADEFAKNLESGTDNFTGRITQRGNIKKYKENLSHHKFVLPHFQMWPIDVHLSYLERPFALLPLDVTPRLELHAPIKEPISSDLKHILAEVGIENDDEITFENPIDQMADKIATMYYTPGRPQDIKDLTILAPELLRGGTITFDVAQAVIINLTRRKA